MEATAMINALAKLRSTFEKPPSDIAIIRQMLRDRVANLDTPEMPPILTPEQRKLFLGKVDKLSAFLSSEDGADAVELLVNSFSKFTEPVKEEAEVVEAAPAPAED